MIPSTSEVLSINRVNELNWAMRRDHCKDLGRGWLGTCDVHDTHWMGAFMEEVIAMGETHQAWFTLDDDPMDEGDCRIFYVEHLDE